MPRQTIATPSHHGATPIESLAKPLRKQLKDVVVKARGTAEDAVRAAILGAAESERSTDRC